MKCHGQLFFFELNSLIIEKWSIFNALNEKIIDYKSNLIKHRMKRV